MYASIFRGGRFATRVDVSRLFGIEGNQHMIFSGTTGPLTKGVDVTIETLRVEALVEKAFYVPVVGSQVGVSTFTEPWNEICRHVSGGDVW